MLSRRALIGKAAVGAAATLALGAAATGVARAVQTPAGDPERDGRNALPADAEATSLPPPWELVSPLVAGSMVGHGWRLVDLGPVHHGACVATLANARGRAHRVHVCRNAGTPHGLIYTRRLDLVVMNEGRGELPTEEGFGQAVAELAHVMAANEARLPAAVVAELLPHAERLERFAAADGTLR